MIATIKSISDLLCRDQITVGEVASALGEIIGGGEPGMPIKVRPTDPTIRAARVVRRDDSEAVSHVDLTPTHPFLMSNLVTVFGAFREVDPSPNPKVPFSVSFDVAPAGKLHTATIFASYMEGDHDAADGTVIAVMVRRD